MLHLARGHDAEAMQALSEVIADSQSSGDAQALGHAEWALAERDLLRGDHEGARARLKVTLAHPGNLAMDASLLALRAWAELLAGDIVRAETTLTQTAGAAGAREDKLCLVDVERIRALLMKQQRRWAEAERVLEDVMELAQGMPYPYAEAKALYVYGQLLTARGEPERARERFEQALAILDRLGEQMYAAHIAQALEALGS